MSKIKFLLARRQYYYDRLLRRTLRLSVLCSAFWTLLLVLAACNNSASSSPFDQVLSQQPYAPLTDSIKLQPKNDELYFRRAVLLNKNNLPEPALADFQKAWSLHKNEKYAKAIAVLWMQKRPDSAVIFLNSALKDIPHSYDLRLIQARSYEALNKTIDALKICEQLLVTYPNHTEVLLLQSELLEMRGDTLRSIAPLEKAYNAAPSNLDLGFKLANKYADLKDPKTIAFCDMLIKKDSLKLFADPYYFKGKYYYNINDKAKAIQLFNETIKHNYNYFSAYIDKGRILLDQKKVKDALKVFQLVNTISPAYPDAYFWIGACQEESGQKQEAKLSYEKAYSLDQTFTEAKEAAERLAK